MAKPDLSNMTPRSSCGSSPLIEPDVRVSRIRLSDWISREGSRVPRLERAAPRGCNARLYSGARKATRRTREEAEELAFPSEEEAVRDLSRCREDAREDLLRARHRLGNAASPRVCALR
jgi:hypothetical protein